MAYFNGSISARPWPRIDVGFMVIFLCSFSGLAVCLYFARDLSFFRGAEASVERRSNSTTAPIAVAVNEVPAGTRLAPHMFRLELQPWMGAEGQLIEDLDEMRGAYARVTIPAGTPLLRAALAKGRQTAEITDRIPSGFRAVAIPVNALTGVAGWVQPGATVDVVWAIEQDKQLTVTTIVENANVLSVERSLEPIHENQVLPDSSPNHITLLVSSQDAQKIQLAKGAGSLQLSLRGAQDAVTAGTDILTTESLLRRPTKRPKATGRVRIDGVEYELRGSELVPSEGDQSHDS